MFSEESKVGPRSYSYNRFILRFSIEVDIFLLMSDARHILCIIFCELYEGELLSLNIKNFIKICEKKTFLDMNALTKN